LPKGTRDRSFTTGKLGKTTLALPALSPNAQKGLAVRLAFVDAEHALDPYFSAKALGVDTDE